MLIFKKDFKGGAVFLQPENSDDLWYLSQLIEPGDEVKSRTLRKIKVEIGDERKAQVTRKPVILALKCEKLELEGDSLRVLGTITEGPDDVSKGSYHSFNVEPGNKLWIKKQEWPEYQRQQLIQVAERKDTNILVVVIDRDEATFAKLTGAKYTILSRMKGDVPKKGDEVQGSSNFFKEVADKIDEYHKRDTHERIIIGSPSFWKDDLLKIITNDAVKKLIVTANCSNSDEQGIKELLKRPELRSILAEVREAEEEKYVEDLFKEIGSDGKAAYGIKETGAASEAGAVEKLLVTDGLIHKLREEGKYDSISKIMRDADRTKAVLKIISSHNDAGKRLDSLGGVGGILRFKISS